MTEGQHRLNLIRQKFNMSDRMLDAVIAEMKFSQLQTALACGETTDAAVRLDLVPIMLYSAQGIRKSAEKSFARLVRLCFAVLLRRLSNACAPFAGCPPSMQGT